MKKYSHASLGVFTAGQAFQLEDVNYPSNWLEHASETWLNANGFTVVDVPEPEPDLATVKEALLKSAKDQTNAKLAHTDWYVIRKAETNKPIPQAIQDEREEARASCDAYEALLNACSTLEQVRALDDITL